MLRSARRWVAGRVQGLRSRIYSAEIERICQNEFAAQKFARLNERPVEWAFLFAKLAMLCPRTVLDVGTGTTALPALLRNCGCLVTAIDNVRDYWPQGMHNRHYHVLDDDIASPRVAGPFDLITCISVLEHVKDPAAAVQGMFALVRPGGHLIFTFPYNEWRPCDNVYALPGSAYGQSAPYVGRAYSGSDIERWCREHGATVLDQEYWRFWSGEYWTQGVQVVPPERVNAGDCHQLTCLLLQSDAAYAPPVGV